MLQVCLNFPNTISIVGILAQTCYGMVDLAHVVLSAVIFHCLVGSVYLVVTQFLWFSDCSFSGVLKSRVKFCYEMIYIWNKHSPFPIYLHSLDLNIISFVLSATSSWNCQFINSCSIADYVRTFTNFMKFIVNVISDILCFRLNQFYLLVSTWNIWIIALSNSAPWF